MKLQLLSQGKRWVLAYYLSIVPFSLLGQFSSTSSVADAQFLGSQHAFSSKESALMGNPVFLLDTSSSNAIQLQWLQKTQQWQQRSIQFSAGFFRPQTAAAIGLSFYGNKWYSEQAVSFAVAHQLSHVGFAARMHLLQWRVQAAPTTYTPLLEIGGKIALSDRDVLALRMYNITYARFSTQVSYVLAAYLCWNWQHQINQHLWTSIELERSLDYQWVTRAGFKWLFSPYFYYAMGVQSRPFQWSTGVGYVKAPLSFALGYNLHRFYGGEYRISCKFEF